MFKSMECDPHNHQQAPRAREDAGKEGRGAGMSDGSGRSCFFTARSCYGVALSGKTALVVRSRRGSSGRVRHAVVSSADAAAWSEWLADSARPENVVAGCVTVQESLTLWLKTPFASVPKAEKVLPSLLDVQLPFPLESCHYRFVDIRRMPDGTTQALAVAARRESLQARLAAYQTQRLNPVLLDHEGLALWTQSLEEYPLPADARPQRREPAGNPSRNDAGPVVRVILWVDVDHVTLVIGQGDRYQNAHSILTNLPALTAETDSGAALEGLVGRIQRIVRAELPAEQRVHWMACGVGARQETLINGLHQSLAVEWPGPLTIHREPETFLARALGTRALTRGPLRCNLRICELAHPLLLRQVRRCAITTAMLFLTAGVLLCGLNLAWRLLAAHRTADAKQAVATLAAGLAPGARIPYGQEVREAQKFASQRAEREAPFLNAFEPSLVARLAELIREGQTQGVAYETLTLQRNGFLLTGTSDDWDRCERLAVRLKAPGYVVKLERQEAVADAQVRFSIKGEKLPAPPRGGI